MPEKSGDKVEEPSGNSLVFSHHLPLVTFLDEASIRISLPSITARPEIWARLKGDAELVEATTFPVNTTF